MRDALASSPKVERYTDVAAARKAVADGDVEAVIVDNSTVISKSVVGQGLSVILDTVHRVVATEKNLTGPGSTRPRSRRHSRSSR